MTFIEPVTVLSMFHVLAHSFCTPTQGSQSLAHLTDEETGSDGPSDLPKTLQKANGRATVWTCFWVNAKLILLLPFAKMEGSMRARTGRNKNFKQSKSQEKQGDLALNKRGTITPLSVTCVPWRLEEYWTDSWVLPRQVLLTAPCNPSLLGS